jgi:hypothetical protein
MLDLAEQLRTYVDDVAPSIELDEVTSRGDDAAARGPRRAGWIAAAAVIVAIALVAGVLVVTRDTAGSHRVATGPTTTTASAPDWLTPYGQEATAPPVPPGWKVLDVGEFRFAVPADWVVPNGPCPVMTGDASGVVMVSDSPVLAYCPAQSGGPASAIDLRPSTDTTSGAPAHVGTLEAVALPEGCLTCGRFRFANGYQLIVSGPDTQRVLDTFTDSGARRALQQGPVADTGAWRTVDYEGVSLRVPRTWGVVDLPASVHQTRDASGRVTGGSGMIEPGTCGGAFFPGASPQLFLGSSGTVPTCPYHPERNLEPTDGAWIRSDTTKAGTAVVAPAVHGVLGGLEVGVITPSATDPPALDLMIHAGGKDLVLTIGVGRDAAIARAILRSLHAT